VPHLRLSKDIANQIKYVKWGIGLSPIEEEEFHLFINLLPLKGENENIKNN